MRPPAPTSRPPPPAQAVAQPQKGDFFDEWSPGRNLWQKWTGKSNLGQALQEQWGIGPNAPWAARAIPHFVGSLGERSADLLALYGGSSLGGAMGGPLAGRFANIGKAATGPTIGVAQKEPGLLQKMIGLIRMPPGASPPMTLASP